MADRLRWQTILAFPGVDVSTSDALIQPREVAAMRRLVGLDPFTELGALRTATGYVLHSSDELVTQGLASYVHGQTQTLYRAAGGALYSYTGGAWAEVESSKLPLHATNRVAFCNGRRALFLVDGNGRPKVIGWEYNAADATVEWDTEHTVAEILYTNGTKATPTTSADDFIATGCCYHMERLFLWKDNKVRASAPYAPTKFYDADNALVMQNWFDVAEQTGLDITWGGSFENQMLIHATQSCLEGRVGTDPATAMSRLVLDADRGVFAPGSAVIGANRLWFCAEDGPCFFDPKEGVKDEPARAIAKVWSTLTADQRKAVVGWFRNGRYTIVLPIPYSDIRGTVPAEACMRLTYDPKTKRWAQGWGTVGIRELVQAPDIERYPLIANGGDIYRQDYGVTLNGTVQDQEILTPWLMLGSPEMRKWVRSLKFELTDSVTELEIAYSIDNIDRWTPFELEAMPARAKWLPTGHPDAVKWLPTGHQNATKWNAPGTHRIDLAESIHCRTFRLRIRGKSLSVKSLAVGFDYEGV